MQIARRLGALVAIGSLAFAGSVDAAETWTVKPGRTTFHFDTALMEQLGLSLTGVEETSSAPASIVPMEGPHWHFQHSALSDLSFEVDNGVYHSATPLSGRVLHEGGFAVRDKATGALYTMMDFEIVPATEQTAIGARTVFEMQEEGATPLFDLVYGGIAYVRGDDVFRVVNFDLKLSPELANEINRPELARKTIGLGEIYADAEWIAGEYTGIPAGPNERGGCDFRDVALGILDDMDYRSRTGSYPTGVVGLSMATTSCNVGNCDVEWYAPMQEDHPGIAMHLYREDADGVLEQIGISNIKHGFFALSSSQCTSCQNPSNGTFLGVGCSDTYGAGNNSDRNWLAPRDEWESFPGTWTCNASHFAAGQNNCNRNHGSSGHGSTEHRLEVRDADLVDPDLDYFFEAYYVVRDDMNKINNIGWRPTWYTRNGDSYTFRDGVPGNSSAGYPVNEGPLIETWGDESNRGTFPGSGEVILSVKVTDIGGGDYQYEYALMNFDADENIGSFSIPVGTASISNIGFNDPNLNDLDDWTASIDGGVITWTASSYTIGYGQMFNFRFTADAMPNDGDAEISSGDLATSIDVTTKIPGFNPASVEVTATQLQLRTSPNPLTTATNISFEMPEAGSANLEVYDASGRLVRTLVSGTMAAGPHAIEWDAKNDLGDRVGSGVFYYRLNALGASAGGSVIVLD